MLEVLIAYFKANLIQLFPDVELHGLAVKSIINDDKKGAIEYPVEYCSNGESNAIDFDNKLGDIYFRQTGEMRVREESENETSCAPYQKREYPMRCVAFIPKNYYKTDNGFIDNKIAENLLRILKISNSKDLRAALKVSSIETIDFKANSNPSEVWQDETDNLRDEVPSDFVLCYVDFTIEVSASLDCFDYWSCNDAAIVIAPESIQILTCANQLCNGSGGVITYEQIEVLIEGGGGLTCETLGDCTIITSIQEDIASLEGDVLDLQNGKVDKVPGFGLSENDYSDAEKALVASALQTISGIAVGGDLSGTLPNPAILNSAVLAKLLTGLNVGGSSIAATDNLLEAFGKLQSQINGVLGGAIYQGVYNATTNSPTLVDGTGTKGNYYVVSVGGTQNFGSGAIVFNVGDWAIYNGAIWQKVDNTDAVSSVNGFIGAVNLTSADISEVTNLYYTNARAIAATLTAYASGAGVVAASDTILQAIQKLNGNIAAIVSCTNANVGAIITAATNYVTPLDADQLPIYDAVNSVLKKVTWVNIKATLKTYNDTLYQATGLSLLKANNLSDLASASTARTNLGLGTLATQSGTFSGTSSGTNTGDQTLPVKATAAELNTGTDDAKFATALGLENSKYLTQTGAKLSATASGTDTYTATIAPAITAYTNTQSFFITFTNANTGASTINLNGLGAKSIKKDVSVALTTGDILAGQIICIAYDGTNFQIIGGSSRDSGLQTYTGAIVFTGTTAPSGATAHQYRWVRHGNMVSMSVFLSYATGGTLITKAVFDLPAGAPTPMKWGATANVNDVLYPGNGTMSPNFNSNLAATRDSGLTINSASTSAYDLFVNSGALGVRKIWINVTYQTA